MTNKIISFFFISLIVGSHVFAADAVRFFISIHEKDPATNDKVLLFADSTDVVKGIASSAFLTGFSLEIEITKVDTQSVDFNVQIVTLGAHSQTMAKRFKSEFDLPATVSDIEVKNGSFYSVTLVPHVIVQVPDHQCNYNHNAESDFTLIPSANFDLHYLPSSLAYFHAPSIKNLMETEYRLFRSKFHFNMTSKLSVFLFPCEVHSVIWDNRFGTAVDPTRNNCYTLYGTDVNTADPFVLIHGSILRSYGYAPLFLSEGLANYFSLALHEMKKFKKSGDAFSLSELLNTRKYLTANPAISDAVSASFVRYLIDEYTSPKFLELYENSNDINLGTQIESIYSKPLKELESEWLNYIDTLKISGKVYSQFADRAQQMINYPLMLEYTKAALELAQTHTDSVQEFEQMAGAEFLNGDYYGAADAQEKLVAIDPKNTQGWISLAAFRMMYGEYDKANAHLSAAQALDSTDEVLQFNFGLNWLEKGDTERAAQYLNALVHKSSSGLLVGEARTMLGQILQHSVKAADHQEAQNDFTLAITYFNQQIESDPAVPNPYMWTGLALVGLNDANNAYDQLKQALFLESRPFYFGMINLWMGKAADLQNKRELAKKHYSEVLATASAVYHQKEAKKYLEKKYAQ